MKVVPVVAACIVNPIDNAVLLVKRYSSNPEINNRWEFPGGRVEPHESLKVALIREIREELNMDIRVLNLLHSQINRYPGEEDDYLVLFYKCLPVNSGQFIVDVPFSLDFEHTWSSPKRVYECNPLPGTKEAAEILYQGIPYQ